MSNVTVIIPAYNRPDDLKGALYSLCAQTVQDFKVIVSDDASAEDLKAVCDDFQGKLDLTYIRNNHNLGCGGNRAAALEYFLTNNPTKYLTFLDSDDAFLPFGIERLEHIIEHNEADIIITNIQTEFRGECKSTIPAEESKTWLHGKIYRSDFLLKNKINFPMGLKSNEDLAFNLSLYAYNPVSYLCNEEVYFFRNNPNSFTKNEENYLRCISIDYIDALYYAFEHFKEQKTPLASIVIASILSLYNHYQKATIFNVLTEKHTQRVRKMIRYHQVALIIVSIYDHPEFKLNLEQWVRRGDSLYFFNQTYGQWILTFFKMEEIQQLVAEYNDTNK